MLAINLEKNLDRIAWGKRFVKVKDGQGNQRFLILKSLDLRDRNFINFIYEEALNDAVDRGVLTDTELKRELEIRSLWTQADEDKIVELEGKLAKSKELVEQARDARDKKRLEKAVEFTRKKLAALVGDRTSKFSTAAERFAETMRVHAILFSVTFNTEEKRYWATWDEFQKETDTTFLYGIITSLNNSRHISEKEIRALARAGVWRTLWNGAKGCGDLFGKPMVHLDSEQHALVYWSQVYDSVYEAYERPDEETIKDDEKLDKWFQDQDKKNKKKEQEKKKSGEPFGISKKVSRHGEIFIAVDQEIRPTNGDIIKPVSIAEVASLNSPSTLAWKNKQFDKVKEKGVVSEKELRPRGDRESRGLINSTDAVLGKARRGTHGTTRDVVDRRPGGTL
jgi:hypothetical protein